MDTGIVQHHDGKGVRRLLGNQAVEGVDDHLGVMVAIVEW